MSATQYSSVKKLDMVSSWRQDKANDKEGQVPLSSHQPKNKRWFPAGDLRGETTRGDPSLHEICMRKVVTEKKNIYTDE